MDRGWYMRFGLVLLVTLGAWLIVWPSISTWVPAPAWVTENISNRIRPGLDIRGGMRLMYTVEVAEAVEDRRDLRGQQLLERLGEAMSIVDEGETPTAEQLSEIRERVRVRSVSDDPARLRVYFNDEEDMNLLDRAMIDVYGDLREPETRGAREVDGGTRYVVTLALTPESIERLREVSVEQARQTIENRIAELGIDEANIRPRDPDIIIEVPGANQEDFDRIRRTISRTARLEFKIVHEGQPFLRELTDVPEGIERTTEVAPDGENNQVSSTFLLATGNGPCAAGMTSDVEGGECSARLRLASYIESLDEAERIPEGHDLLLGRYADTRSGEAGEESWRTWYLHSRAEASGDDLDDASIGFDPQSQTPNVNFTMNSSGARAMEELTTRNLQRRMAIVLDDRVESAPVIQGRISSRGMITLGSYGDYNTLLNEANELVVVLRAGALPAPITPQNQQHIGATLGADSVARGLQGALIGIVLVLIFMAFYYQTAGVVADVMVVLNLLFLLGLMAFRESALTLPGLAGIALTVGMAVDANVLITERIREELRMGKSARAAVDQGFGRAFWSIFDSQLTTFIAGIVLYQFGTGPIQGFAVTLMYGILTSLFTGVFCSKVMFDWIVRGLRVQRLRVG